jgi:hypothetical protein
MSDQFGKKIDSVTDHMNRVRKKRIPFKKVMKILAEIGLFHGKSTIVNRRN